LHWGGVLGWHWKDASKRIPSRWSFAFFLFSAWCFISVWLLSLRFCGCFLSFFFLPFVRFGDGGLVGVDLILQSFGTMPTNIFILLFCISLLFYLADDFFFETKKTFILVLKKRLFVCHVDCDEFDLI
jgi:hypothetical protein